MGMKDSSYYLTKELDTWDISHFQPKNLWQETLNKATLWLDQ